MSINVEMFRNDYRQRCPVLTEFQLKDRVLIEA